LKSKLKVYGIRNLSSAVWVNMMEYILPATIYYWTK